MDLNADLTVMINGAPGAVTVVVGAVSGYGVEDVSKFDLTEAGGMAVERVREVLVSEGVFSLASLARGTAITVDGTAYKIREAKPDDEGGPIRVICV